MVVHFKMFLKSWDIVNICVL